MRSRGADIESFATLRTCGTRVRASSSTPMSVRRPRPISIHDIHTLHPAHNRCVSNPLTSSTTPHHKPPLSRPLYPSKASTTPFIYLFPAYRYVYPYSHSLHPLGPFPFPNVSLPPVPLVLLRVEEEGVCGWGWGSDGRVRVASKVGGI